MLRAYAACYVRLARILAELKSLPASGMDTPLSDNQFRQCKRLLNELLRLDVDIVLPMVSRQITRLDHLLDEGCTNSATVINSLSEIRNRLEDELDAHKFLYVPPDNAQYYDSTFGQNVEATFPAIVEDASESGKCLALGRATAAVFHQMRILEHVVQRLGSKLNVTIIDKNDTTLDWGLIIANMKIPIEKMHKGELKDKWSEALTLLVHVKQAWRHPTMHPKQTYTEGQAKEGFFAVRSFVAHLANLMT